MKTSLLTKSSGLVSGVSAFAIAAALTVAVPLALPMETGSVAFAQQR